MTCHRKGFTLLELIIVVSILGLLASIAMVKYVNTMRKANEGALIGDLGAVRSALSIYYSDMEGVYPSELSALTANPKNLSVIPQALVPNYHPASSLVSAGTVADDSGGWLYNNSSIDDHFGSLYVNCTHTDSKGSLWSSY